MVKPAPLINTPATATGPYKPRPVSMPATAAVAAMTAITTPDATDEASAVTLANATKAKVNLLIAALQG